MITTEIKIENIRKGCLVNLGPRKGFIEPTGGLEYAIVSDLWQSDAFVDELSADIIADHTANPDKKMPDIFVFIHIDRPSLGFTNYCIECRERAFALCPCHGHVPNNSYNEHPCPYKGFTNTTLHYTHPQIDKGYYYLMCPLLSEFKCPHTDSMKEKGIDVLKNCVLHNIKTDNEISQCVLWQQKEELLINLDIKSKKGEFVHSDLLYSIKYNYVYHKSIYSTKTSHVMDEL